MKNKKFTVAFLGTNGIPACYGGCETMYENLAKYQHDDFDITVYCSNKATKQEGNTFMGAKLKYTNLSANGIQGILYDILTLIDARKNDCLYYFGPSAGFMIPLLRFFGCKKNIVVNHGGLNEWEREKLSKWQRIYTKWVFRLAAKYATVNVVDNDLYKESLKETFGVDSVVIRYGGDNAVRGEATEEIKNKYPFIGEKYAVAVARAQVDNNLHIVLEAFSKMSEQKLVLVSNWEVSEYGRNLRAQYKDKFSNIIILDSIYDQKELSAIRSNAYLYIHSHSRCGTPPSLCEAMYLGLPVLAYEMPVNHETTQGKALFFKDVDSLIEEVRNADENKIKELGEWSKKIAESEYRWKHIADQYAETYRAKHIY